MHNYVLMIYTIFTGVIVKLFSHISLMKLNVFTFMLPIGYKQLKVIHLLIAGDMCQLKLTLLMIVLGI